MIDMVNLTGEDISILSTDGRRIIIPADKEIRQFSTFSIVDTNGYEAKIRLYRHGAKNLSEYSDKCRYILTEEEIKKTGNENCFYLVNGKIVANPRRGYY